jgi:hypothetical protein
MANEILFADLSGSARLAAVLHQEIVLKLADRASLHMHPSILRLGNVAGRGSSVVQIPVVGLDGSDIMSSIADGSAVSNTALTETGVNVTVARNALQYSISDLANLTDSVGLNVQRLAESMVGSTLMTFQSLLCNVIDDFTTVVGTSGVDMSVDDFYSAQFALTLQSVAGPYICILHPRQLADFQASLRAEAGPSQFVPATQEMLNIKGQGFAGMFNGVDIFVSSKVVTANAGADRAGAMFGYGAVAMAEGSPYAITGAGGIVQPAGTPLVVEFERDASSALTKIVGNYYAGVAKVQDGQGVSIVTDA